MLIGLIGAPNKGKSTLFSAMTLVEAEIASYPFTTIRPNLGVAHATKECVEKELEVKCNPRNSLCINGVRHIPINITDVAGLVPGAHLGRGMGTQLLNDIMGADMLVQVVDLSGETDSNGNPCMDCDPSEEVRTVREEMSNWLSGIINKHIPTLSKRSGGAEALNELLSSFGTDLAEIKASADLNNLPLSYINWDKEAIYKFSDTFLRMNKPVVIAANKLDKGSKGKLDRLKTKLKDYTVMGCSAAIELALRRAVKSGVIEYMPGSKGFYTRGNATDEQREALSHAESYLRQYGSTGVQELINYSIFEVLKRITVYPVENDNRYTDHSGSVLPDVLLVEQGTKAVEMAAMIHSEIAEKMLNAIDAKTKKRLPKDHILEDDDVIKIVSAAKK